MERNYLPIGSVVLLKNAKKRLMITGFYVKPDLSSDKVYDYVGCLYPEGVITSTENAVFNHDQIENIFSVGFSDLEEQEFKAKLYNAIDNDLSKNNDNSTLVEKENSENIQEGQVKIENNLFEVKNVQ